MLCDKCKMNQASIHLSQNINGMQTELHLCEDCARKEQNVMSIFNEDSFFNSFFDTSFFKRGSRRNSLMSSFFDMTDGQRTIAQRQQQPDSVPTFEKMGLKLPNLEGINPIDSESSVDDLKRDLQDALEKEDYEQAAKIRDEIKKLEME